MTLQLLHSEFPYTYMKKIWFSIFISVATASEGISPEIHVPISRVEVPQALRQIEGFPATRPKLEYTCIARNIYIQNGRKWIGNFPVCKGYGTTYRCNTYYILYLCKGGGRGPGEMVSIYFALCFESKVEHYFEQRFAPTHDFLQIFLRMKLTKKWWSKMFPKAFVCI